MTLKEVMDIHNGLTAKGFELMLRKNADYADTQVSRDPFKNFRVCESMGFCSAEKGILVRLSDKISRVTTLIDKPPQVSDESFEDTIVDAINYLVLLSALRKDRGGK